MRSDQRIRASPKSSKNNNMNNVVITTQNLSFQYTPKQATLQFPDITLRREDDLLILGRSGIGKTTLLHLIAGLLKPTTGSIGINSIDLQTLSSRKRDQFTGKHIGMVFQKNHAIRSLTVMQNLQARLFFSGLKAKENQLSSLLAQLGLEQHLHNKVNTLSEGQLQRLGIALAMVHKPQLILADEPTSSLDDANCNNVIHLLKQQAEQHQANLIVITHDARIKPVFKNVLTL